MVASCRPASYQPARKPLGRCKLPADDQGRPGLAGWPLGLAGPAGLAGFVGLGFSWLIGWLIGLLTYWLRELTMSQRSCQPVAEDAQNSVLVVREFRSNA